MSSNAKLTRALERLRSGLGLAMPAYNLTMSKKENYIYNQSIT